jgi:hypothetical protein
MIQIVIQYDGIKKYINSHNYIYIYCMNNNEIILYESIFFILQLLMINMYVILINNVLPKKLNLYDNLFFILLLTGIMAVWGYIFITFKNVTYENLIEKIKNNILWLSLTSVPVSILQLVSVVDTSINVVNLLSFCLSIPVNMTLNLLIIMFFLQKPDKTNILYKVSSTDKFIKRNNLAYTFALIVSTTLTGVLFTLSNNSKIGPIGLTITIVSTVINQMINIAFEYDNLRQMEKAKQTNPDNVEEINQTNDNTQVNVKQQKKDSDYALTYLYVIFFEFIYTLIIAFFLYFVVQFGYGENVDFTYYFDNLYIPFFISIFIAVYRIESYTYKKIVNSFGMLTNINNFIVITIINFLTPLFDKTIKNKPINYIGLIPLIISIVLYGVIDNKNKNNENSEQETPNSIQFNSIQFNPLQSKKYEQIENDTDNQHHS